MKERLGSLVSGNGTTFEHIVNSYNLHEHPIEPALLVASKPGIGAIKRAYDLDIPYEIVNPDDFRGNDRKVDEEGFGKRLLEVFEKHGVTVVTQNGWLHKTPKIVIDEFEETIFNQHPGPKKETGKTYGRQPHELMLYIARETGRNNGTEVIVHRVTENVDEGATVGRKYVPILDINESAEILQKRALPNEHELFVEVLDRLSKGEISEMEQEIEYVFSDEIDTVLKPAIAHAKEKYRRG